MNMKASFIVRATPEQVELAFQKPVTDLKVMVLSDGSTYSNLETHDWRQERADERTYFYRPATDARLRLQPGDKHTLKVTSKQESRRQSAEVDIEVQKSQAAAADGQGDSGGLSQASQRTRTSCCDEVANILKVPLRVRAGGASGGPGGEDLESWSEGIIESVFPRLPHRPDALQFQQSLAEFVGAAAAPSPYGGGSVAFAPRPVSPGCGAPGGWSVNGGSGAWSASGVAGWPSSPQGASGWGGGGSSAYPLGAETLSAPSTPSASFPGGAWPGTGGALGMGDLTGPFATLASIAGALEANAEPSARDVGALTQDADLDRIEAERAVVLQILSSLISELRQPAPDGPEKPTAESLAERLLEHVVALGVATEILVPDSAPPTDPTDPPPTKSTEAVTPADFANVSRFDVLYGWGISAWIAVRAFDPDTVDARARVAIVKQLLGVIVEKTRQLELELDAADFGPAERGRFEVTLDEDGEITVARLLQWLQEQGGRDLPRLLDNSGTLAKDTVVTTLREQKAFVSALADLPDFPWTYPIVDRLLDELFMYLDEAITEAESL
jgi:hypothetical protein